MADFIYASLSFTGEFTQTRFASNPPPRLKPTGVQTVQTSGPAPTGGPPRLCVWSHSYLEDPLGEARLLSQLLQVLRIRVVVDGEVGLHGPELVVLEGGPHALGLLRGAVLGVPLHGLAVVLVTAQSCREQEGTKSEPHSWTQILLCSLPPPPLHTLFFNFFL